MSYYADFRMHEGHQFRLDTRIYLGEDGPGDEDDCVAAVIGKNPGSANPTLFDQLSLISLDGDKLLPFVRNRFRNAYRRAGLELPAGAYVRIWNLVYLCNPDLPSAVRTFRTVQTPLSCDSEGECPPIVWFAWGPPSPSFRPFKSRFLTREYLHPFYYDRDSEVVVASVPGQAARVKHTQGLPAEPVEIHLAALIAAGPVY